MCASAACFDLAAAQAAVIPPHVLVKTGFSMSILPDFHHRITPPSGFDLKKFIDATAGVIDSDYRRKVGAILFSFCDNGFTKNMGDKMAQLVNEKKIPVSQKSR